jgi:hypothetical protein
MRRKIHGVFGIIKGVNMQINFDPFTLIARARLPRRSFMQSLDAHAPARSLIANR